MTPADKALWLLPPTNPLRRALFSIVDDKRFEALVLLVILFNCGVMAVQNPGNSQRMGGCRGAMGSGPAGCGLPCCHGVLHATDITLPAPLQLRCCPPAADLTRAMELGCFGFYVAELLAKLLALGAVSWLLWRHATLCKVLARCLYAIQLSTCLYGPALQWTDKRSYLRTPWNVLDCFIIASSVLATVFAGAQWASCGRLLRALRPLRLASQVPHIQVRRIGLRIAWAAHLCTAAEGCRSASSPCITLCHAGWCPLSPPPCRRSLAASLPASLACRMCCW